MEVEQLKSPEQRWGIIVGVDEYPNTNGHFANLQGCVVDANNMFKVMTGVDVDERFKVMTGKEGCGFLTDHVIPLPNATSDQIERAFKTIGARMEKGDELWFYYAGHGYSQKGSENKIVGYLLPSDAKDMGDGEPSKNSCISSHTLRDLIEGNITKGEATIVLFLDCCCAAAIGQMDGTRAVSSCQKEMAKNFRESFRDLKPTVEGNGNDWNYRYISFMATDQTGKAHEDASGGVFTKALAEGLTGKGLDIPGKIPSDQYIRAGELGVFLAEQLTDQEVCQDVKEPNFPLCVSQSRKARLDENLKKMKHVKNFVLEFQLDEKVLDFAEDMIRTSAVSRDFPYVGLFRDLLYSLSVNSDRPWALEKGAELASSFYELKKLRAQKNEQSKTEAPKVETKPQAASRPEKEMSVSEMTPQAVSTQTTLSTKDKQLLENIHEVLKNAETVIDLDGVQPRIEDDPVGWLHIVARKRMRKMCETVQFAPLFKKAYCAAWHESARKRRFTDLEEAVFELVQDDEALANAKEKLCAQWRRRA